MARGFFSKLFGSSNSDDAFDEYMGNPRRNNPERRALIEQRKAERLAAKEAALNERDEKDLFDNSINVKTSSNPSSVLKDRSSIAMPKCNAFSDAKDIDVYEDEEEVDEFDEAEARDRAAYDALVADAHAREEYTTNEELRLILKYSKEEVDVQPMYADDIRCGIAEILDGTSKYTVGQWYKIIEMSFEYDFISKEDYFDLKDMIGL